MCVNIIYVCICLYCVICLILYYRSLLICTNKEFMNIYSLLCPPSLPSSTHFSTPPPPPLLLFTHCSASPPSPRLLTSLPPHPSPYLLTALPSIPPLVYSLLYPPTPPHIYSLFCPPPTLPSSTHYSLFSPCSGPSSLLAGIPHPDECLRWLPLNTITTSDITLNDITGDVNN